MVKKLTIFIVRGAACLTISKYCDLWLFDQFKIDPLEVCFLLLQTRLIIGRKQYLWKKRITSDFDGIRISQQPMKPIQMFILDLFEAINFKTL